MHIKSNYSRKKQSVFLLLLLLCVVLSAPVGAEIQGNQSTKNGSREDEIDKGLFSFLWERILVQYENSADERRAIYRAKKEAPFFRFSQIVIVVHFLKELKKSHRIFRKSLSTTSRRRNLAEF